MLTSPWNRRLSLEVAGLHSLHMPPWRAPHGRLKRMKQRPPDPLAAQHGCACEAKKIPSIKGGLSDYQDSEGLVIRKLSH